LQDTEVENKVGEIKYSTSIHSGPDTALTGFYT